MSKLTRRDFILLNAASLGAISTGLDVRGVLARSSRRCPPMFVDVDFEALISTSDLHYLSPVENSTEGQPIGNGHMGTFVWTTPGSLAFQINRVDAFAVNRDHMGRFMQAEDHCGSCGAVTIEMGGEPFGKSDEFHQRLSLYGAESQVQGQGVQARCFVSAVSDVLVLEIDDQRPQPMPLRLTLSVWGKKMQEVEGHVSSFEFAESGEKYGVARKFTEGNYYCRYGVAVHVVNGRAKLDTTTETTRTFVLERPPTGKTVIHISSAASMDPKVDIVGHGFDLLDQAANQSYETLQLAHRAWWSSFWARTFIAIQSTDGIAKFIQQVRNIHLYVMASTSRGALAPKWNDMLFSTRGDERGFGSQYWEWTMEPLYMPLFAAGASDLADPYFNMHVAQLPQCRIAAAQRWNAKGAFFPEISPFDGPRTMPDDVAREYRDILLDNPKRHPLSERAGTYGQFDIPLVDFPVGGPVTAGSYTQNSHIFVAGARIAQQAWFRYRHTGDKKWLGTHAYPLLKETAEFYRSVLMKEADGRYHLERGGMADAFQGIKDSISDLAAIRGIVPAAIRSAEILGEDVELRAQWKEFLEHLAPFTMGKDPESKAYAGSVLADDVWSAGHKADGTQSIRGDEDVWTYPIIPFESYTLESSDPETTRIAKKTVTLLPVYSGLVGEGLGLGTSARTPIAVARVGRGEDLPRVLGNYYLAFPNLPNGFSPFEIASSVEHLAIMSMTLQEGLLQSVSGAPGEAEVIRVFPAWPKAWDATFSLSARGGFLVAASIKNGLISFVEIESQRGELCRIRNPWKAACVLVEGGQKKQVSEDLIQFPTKAGQKYQLFQGEPPLTIRIAPKSEAIPTSFTFTRSNGAKVEARLGRAR